MSTIAIALSILGIFLVCYRNFERVAEATNPSVTGTLYLKANLTELEVSALKDRVLALENVQRVVFKSSATVTSELSTFLGGGGGEPISSGELFPDILELELRRDAPGSAVSLVKANLVQFPEITEVDFSEDWLSHYKNIRGVLRLLGILLISGTVIGCAFLIANFMGMRHQQRKSEIDIVRLIGANQSFVLSPFLWEGVIEGVLGTVSALIVLLALKRFVFLWIAQEWVDVLGMQSWLFLSPLQLVFFVSLGVFMSFLGSFGVFIRFREKIS